MLLFLRHCYTMLKIYYIIHTVLYLFFDSYFMLHNKKESNY